MPVFKIVPASGKDEDLKRFRQFFGLEPREPFPIPDDMSRELYRSLTPIDRWNLHRYNIDPRKNFLSDYNKEKK